MRFTNSTLVRSGLMTVTAVTAIFWLGSGSAQAQNSTYAHLDELAVQMQRHAREMREEAHHHMRDNRYFWQMDRVAHSIEDLADHLHETAHNRGSLHHIRRDVEQLDRLVHYAENLTDQIRRRVHSHHEREVVQTMHRSIHSMLSVLHHMQDDLRQLDPHFHHHGDVHNSYRSHDSAYRWHGNHNHNGSYRTYRYYPVYPRFGR